jgi:hypothetical protein
VNPSKGDVQTVLARLDGLAPGIKPAIITTDFAVLYGYLQDNGAETLPVILKESTLSVRKERFQGRDLWVLEGTGKWGQVRLWLDPALEYWPRRIVQHKSEKDWYGREKTIESLRASPPFRPRAAYRGIHRDIELTDYHNVKGVMVPTKLALTEVESFVNNPDVTYKTRVTLSGIDLRPDFITRDLFTMSAPIRNGTYVQVDDRPGIEFEWQNGEIVKRINTDTVERLEGNVFMPEPGFSRSLILVGAILGVVVLLVAFLFFWKQSTRRFMR